MNEEQAINIMMYPKEVIDKLNNICSICGHDNSLVLGNKCEHYTPCVEVEE